jgi:hypothetical protein
VNKTSQTMMVVVSLLVGVSALAGTLVENAFRLRSPLSTPYGTLPSGSVAVRVTQGSTTVALLWTTPSAVVALGCDGVSEAGMDYLDDVTPPAWQAPAGEWCAVRIELDESLHLIGEDLYDVPFDLELSPSSLQVGETSGPERQNDFYARISSPAWLSELQAYIDEEGSTGVIDTESDLYEALLPSATGDAWLQDITF